MVYPFSHLFFPKLRSEFGIVESKNFVQLPNHALIAIQTDARRFFPDSHPYSLQNRPDKPFPIMPIIMEAEPGDMLFWDSSTWHQNVYQCYCAALYICMLPRQNSLNVFRKAPSSVLNLPYNFALGGSRKTQFAKAQYSWKRTIRSWRCFTFDREYAGRNSVRLGVD